MNPEGRGEEVRRAPSARIHRLHLSAVLLAGFPFSWPQCCRGWGPMVERGCSPSLKSLPSSWLGQRLTMSVTCSAFL